MNLPVKKLKRACFIKGRRGAGVALVRAVCVALLLERLAKELSS